MREPLEHFVILQLTEMRERENRLRNQLSGADGTCHPEILANELWQLRQCADRLDQMIDTMTAPELAASASIS